MILKIHQAGQPILRRPATPLTKSQLASTEVQEFIDHMIETLRDAPGVGLAAPQVGKPLQIFIVEDKAKYHKQVAPTLLKAQNRKTVQLKVIINPEIEIIETNQELFFEGCLSVDGYVGAVARASKVKVSGLDRHGKQVSHTATGWFARILQHEMNHLHGELYIDRMHLKSFMTVKNFAMLWREALPEKINKHFKST